MSKVFLTLIFVFSLTACASRRKVEQVQMPQATPAPVSHIEPKIKYVYIDRTLPTESAMTMPPLTLTPPREIDLWRDIVRFLWPLMALLGAGAVMIAGLYAEHVIIERRLAMRRARKNTS